MLPMPPTTTTTNASAMTRRGRAEIGAGSRGICSAPPRPASNAPSANTAVKSPAWFDAERADHLAVLGRGAHQRAPARAREQQPQRAEHDRADRDQEKVVLREGDAEDVDRPARPGARPEQVLGAPEPEREVLDHQHEREGGQQLEQLGRAVDPPQEQRSRSARRRRRR